MWARLRRTSREVFVRCGPLDLYKLGGNPSKWSQARRNMLATPDCNRLVRLRSGRGGLKGVECAEAARGLKLRPRMPTCSSSCRARACIMISRSHYGGQQNLHFGGEGITIAVLPLLHPLVSCSALTPVGHPCRHYNLVRSRHDHHPSPYVLVTSCHLYLRVVCYLIMRMSFDFCYLDNEPHIQYKI